MDLTTGKYLGEYNHMKLYQMTDGFIEGYRTLKDKNGFETDIVRVVTLATTVSEFLEMTKKRRKRVKTIEDPMQLKIT